MITEKHYTDNNEHPEDKIYRVKSFINELENVQTFYYNQLLLELQMSEEIDDHLFDYIYNEPHDSSFEDYLSNYNLKYKDFEKKSDDKQ